VLEDAKQGGGKEESNTPSPPPSFSLCPLSILKEAKADIFLVGDAPTAPADGDDGKTQDAQQHDQEWVLLPPLPRVEIHHSEGEEGNLSGAVLHYLVHEVKDERVIDVLQAMLWTSGGSGGIKNGKREKK
jgi:hypothetical protein